MTVARIYTRVSTTRQSDGASLETQLAACRAYCAAHGVAVASEHTDILSGTRDDRPAYQALLDLLQPAEIVIVWRMDRVGRRKSETFRFFEWCKQRHIGIVSVTQPEMSSELSRDLLTVLAAHESQQIAERVMPNMTARATQGRWVSRVPFGYRLPDPHEPDYADGHLVPSEDAQTVRDLYAAYLAHGAIDGTARRFGLTIGRTRDILTARTYLGEARWNGVAVPNAHPAIVDAATWAAVQSRIASRQRTARRARAGIAMLTGFLYAEDSDLRMYHNTYRGVGARWYGSAAKYPGQINCSIPGALAERLVLDDLRAFALSPAARRAYERDLLYVARADPHRRVRAALARDRERLRTAADRAASAYANGLIDEASLLAVRREQERERARLDAEERALPPIPDLARAMPALALRVGLARTVDDYAARDDRDGIRRLIEALLTRIEAWDCRRTGERGWMRHHAVQERPPRIVCRSIFPG